MPNFLVRVALHGAGVSDYEKLNLCMASHTLQIRHEPTEYHGANLMLGKTDRGIFSRERYRNQAAQSRRAGGGQQKNSHSSVTRSPQIQDDAYGFITLSLQ